MTTKKPRPHSALIKAWADGETIQIKSVSNYNWVDISSPAFNINREYRVKPIEKWEPKTNYIFSGRQVAKFARLTAWLQENSTTDDWKIGFSHGVGCVSFIYYSPIEDLKKLEQLIADEIVVL